MVKIGTTGTFTDKAYVNKIPPKCLYNDTSLMLSC